MRALALVLLLAAAARAEDGFDVQTFKPALDPYGYATASGARSLAPLQPHAALYASWMRRPVAFAPDDPAASDEVVNDLFQIDAVAAIGLLAIGAKGGLEAGIGLPIVLVETGRRLDDRDEDFDAPAFGQLRTELKLTLLDRDDEGAPVGFAVRAFAEWATARERDLLSNLGRSSFGATAIVEKRAGALRAALEVGYQWIDGRGEVAEFVVDDELRGSIAAGYAVSETLEAYVELAHATPIRTPWSGKESPLEARLGVRWAGPVLLVAGAGRGVYQAVGAPDVRLFAGIGKTF